MVNWNYEEQEDSFAPIPEGNYRVRINKVEETVSSTNKDMLNITLDVSGKNSKLFYRLVFNPANPRMTNQNLQKIYDSFGITRGDMNFQSWVGKVGACKVRHSEYLGEKRAEVHYFLSKNQSSSLPAWQEPKSDNNVKLSAVDDIQF